MSNAIKNMQAQRAQAKTLQSPDLATVTSSELLPETDKPSEENFEPPVGGFKALRLRQFARPDGTMVYPVNGYYVPTTEEDYDLLQYYLSKGNLVENEVQAKTK